MFKVRVQLFCFVCAVLLTLTAAAQNDADFDSIPPEKLFEQAWQTTGSGEKLIIRSYLAGKYADTQFGLFSRAWIADHDGDAKAAGALYSECLQRYPKFLYCLLNSTGSISDLKERLAVEQRGMQIDPTFDHMALIRKIYFLYVDDLKDEKAAADFLAIWEGRYPESFMFPFIRGLYSEFNLKDYAKAESFYAAAAEKNPDYYEIAARMAAVRLKKADAVSAGDLEKMRTLRPAIEFANNHAQSDPLAAYNALMSAADTVKTDFKPFSLELYLAAFRVHPAEDPVSPVVNGILRYSRSGGLGFLETARKAMPHSGAVLRLLGSLTEDVREAEGYYQEAIARAPTPGERTLASILMAQRLCEDRLLDYDRAHQILKELLQQPMHLDHVYAALFNDRLEAADFPSAKAYLDQFEAYTRRTGDINENYFRQYNALLAYYLNNESAARRYHERNPFLAYWQEQFGESLRISVNFATDSDVIPASDYSKLNEIARLLQDKGADKYAFAIEGHTDNTGPDALNTQLSKRRAEAVAQYLTKAEHIAPNRLQPAGYGSLHPIASNATAEGRAQNRRVEILPVGNLTSPQIVATAALPLSAEGELQNDEADPGLNHVPEISSSPDGRYLAIGRDPMELWDSETGIRLKQFGFAGKRKFSPNGRYIASLSQYRFPGNIVKKTLFVDDVKTGLRVVQLPLSDEVADLVWDPFSSRIAYLNDSGQICVYDMHKHRKTSCISTGGKLIVGPILWTHDGRYILSAKAQESQIKVWDAESLQLVRTLDGVDWPHGLAETSDGRYIVCTDNRRTITVWDRKTWQSRQADIPNLANQVIPHPEKPLVMLGDFGGGDHQHGTLFDVASMKVVASIEEGPEGARYAFSADGRKIFRSRPDEISILDAATLRQTGALTGTAVNARGGLADTKNSHYLSFDDAGIHVWDVKTGQRIQSWPLAVDRLDQIDGDKLLAISADAKARQTRLWIIDTTTLETSSLAPLNFRVDRVAVKGRSVVFAGTAFSGSDNGEENGIVETYDPYSWRKVGRIQVPLVTESLEYGRIAGSRIDSLDISPNGSSVAIVSAWMDGFGHPYKTSKEVRVFDVSSGVRTSRHTFATEITSVAAPDDDHVEATTRDSTWAVDRKTDKRVRAGQQVSGENLISLRGGSQIVWSRASIRTMGTGRSLVLNTDDVVNVGVFEDRNLLVALSGSNEIAFYRLSDLTKIVTIISKRGGEWIAYTPDSEFAASSGGKDKVSWSLGDRLLDFKAMASRFEHPTLLKDLLQHEATTAGEGSSYGDKTTAPEW